MRHSKLLQLSLSLTLLSLLIAGCGTQSRDTQSVIEPTTASLPPSPQPEETEIEGTPVLSLDEIIGSWESNTGSGGIQVMLIQPDGEMNLADTSLKLVQGYTETYQIWVEDNQVYFDLPWTCSEGVGSYQANISEDGVLDFIVIDDPCSYRVKRLDGSTPEEFHEYEILFHRIEDMLMTSVPLDCNEVTGNCVELTFDGGSCMYQGPENMQGDRITVIYFNRSDVTNVSNFVRLQEDKTKADLDEYYGAEETTSEHHPTWTAEVAGYYARIEPGETYVWEGEIEPGVHFLVCGEAMPLLVYKGGVFTVEK